MRRVAPPVATLVLAGMLALLFAGHGSGGASANAQSAGRLPTAGDSFESMLGLPATEVRVLGAAPVEGKGEVWAFGAIGDVPAVVDGATYADQIALLEHTEASGWQVVPLPQRPGGGPLSKPFEGGPFPEGLGSLGGRVTPAGGVALLTGGGIVVRDPGGVPQLIPKPGETAEKPSEGTKPAEATAAELLGKTETLPPSAPPSGVPTAYAAIDEDGGRTGVLLAPYDDGAATSEAGSKIAGPGVLHFDGRAWTREPIAWQGSPQEGFTPQALACGDTQDDVSVSSPQNCWLLAAYHAGGVAGEANRLALFRRVAAKGASVGWVWERVSIADWMLGEQAPPSGVSGTPSVRTLGPEAQTLTVTSQGVWVDFQAKINGSSAFTSVSELVGVPTSESASVLGTWCYPTVANACVRSLGASLPDQYRSFALAGASSGESGTRIVTGLPGGAMLELASGSFEHAIGAGGSKGGGFGAAFSFAPQGSVEEGWIGEGSTATYDHQGQSQIVEVTATPQGDQLQQAPVPFRHPLLAVTQAPGTTPGDPNAEAMAVGVDGEIGRYTPGQGWTSESMYNSAGEAETPTLRGVAWPEHNRAYAVGDKGAMWVWRAESGLWEPDPAEPYNFIGNLTAIAFSPSDPDVGYAVGKQGVLLKHGKTWEQVSLSPALQRANFTSIAFAGSEALATYRTVVEDQDHGKEQVEAGGLAIEDGSGWQVDTGVSSVLAQLPDVRDTVLSKVAGLPDGAAVAAGPGLVIEREGNSSGQPADEWHLSSQPLPEAQNVSALAAYQEAGGQVRAIVSVDLDEYLNPNSGDLFTNAYKGDLPPPAGEGQPPPYLSPDPLPSSGYVLRETASGWSDMEHMALEETGEGAPEDEPARPDPVLALLVNAGGSEGLAVGGQTGNLNGGSDGSILSPDLETAGVMRFGVSVSTDGGDASAPIPVPKGQATFAVGGGAACEHPCANFANEMLAPDVLLTHALQVADQLAVSSDGALRGFLYTGGRVRSGTSSLEGDVFERELDRYAGLLGSAGGSLPVYATSSPDVALDGEAPLLEDLASFMPGHESGGAYYAVTSSGSTGGSVRVIVLDFSSGTLGPTQERWLEAQLAAAKVAHMPAIVMGDASLGFTLSDPAGDDPPPAEAQPAAVTSVSRILVEDGASAYLFEYPGVNVEAEVSYGAKHIPAFGTGTLGYSSPPGSNQTDSLGSSGFLLLSVETAARSVATNIAPVSARVEPNIGELALQAATGTLLRRSQVGLFEALARIPASGRAIVVDGSGHISMLGPEPYEPIPFNCQGADCVHEVPTDFTFTSSNPDIGGFVLHEAASNNPLQVQLNTHNEPVHDEPMEEGGKLKEEGGELMNEDGEHIPRTLSGLFCAYNPGTTVVTITAGGLSYSETVTVQGGSPEYPCGTVPLKNPPLAQAQTRTEIPTPRLEPASSPPAATPQIQAIAPPPAPILHHPRPPAPTLPVTPATLPALFPLRPVVPPPAPNPARPTPPSGTAQVTQPVGITQDEEQRESATESVHHMSAYQPDPRGTGATSLDAYRAPAEGPMPAWPVALVAVAVASGIALRRGSRSERLARVRLERDERRP